MATVLAQTENRPKTTNGPHVVSNFTQRRFIATQFPEKIDDVSKMLHLLSSYQRNLAKINICHGFATYFRLNFRSYKGRERLHSKNFSPSLSSWLLVPRHESSSTDFLSE